MNMRNGELRRGEERWKKREGSVLLRAAQRLAFSLSFVNQYDAGFAPAGSHAVLLLYK